MKTRILVGIPLVLLMIVALYFGGYTLLVTLSLFSFAAIYEIGLLFRRKGFYPIMGPAYLFALTFCFVYRFFGLLPMIVLYMAAVMTTMMAALLNKTRSMSDAVPSLFIFCYPTLFLVCMLLVYFSFDRSIALIAAGMAYAAPSCADTFAYFGGTLLGRHKLCPDISPKKTVEGAVFALIGGVLCGLGMSYLQRVWGESVHPAVLMLLGFGCGVFSEFGDLFASALKRWASIKDFSSIFPGHGGVVDRIDSILFCAPLVLCVFVVLGELSII